ncbi:hypothetical protein J6590_007484 [Homalodisca vitripennis]|nr:hypothetical protein J6590_007484 [Homalodisca vitripennis]
MLGANAPFDCIRYAGDKSFIRTRCVEVQGNFSDLTSSGHRLPVGVSCKNENELSILRRHMITIELICVDMISVYRCGTNFKNGEKEGKKVEEKSQIFEHLLEPKKPLRDILSKQSGIRYGHKVDRTPLQNILLSADYGSDVDSLSSTSVWGYREGGLEVACRFYQAIFITSSDPHLGRLIVVHPTILICDKLIGEFFKLTSSDKLQDCHTLTQVPKERADVAAMRAIFIVNLPQPALQLNLLTLFRPTLQNYLCPKVYTRQTL